ncbi:hypothetical protein PybrP1_006698 [[Pythium] brassicae (nom. inval.)]|nr:hypothetical protein PybrP1_006698 [[Pythium] brassicae (nom. inval.)]
MTALPWSAGNMLRMKWSEELAGAAIAAAKGCAVTSGAGINAFTYLTGASVPVIDAAMNSWAENGAYEALAEIKAPGKDGVGIGIGVYNSYSQIVWAATNQVGCGYAACTTGKHVVCKYAVPGNKAGEPWYVHAQPDTMCPAGTKGMQGLCVVPDDPGNADIAPIPAGQHAYEVFKGFIGGIQMMIENVAKGGPMTGGAGGSTNPGKAGDGGPMTGGAGGSTNPGTTAAPGTAATTAPTGDASTTTTAPSPAMTDATGTKSPSKTTTDGSGESSAAGATDKSNGDTAAKSIDFGSLMNTAGDKPGTVNAGSHSGTAFSNATPSEATTSGAAASPSTAPSGEGAATAGLRQLPSTALSTLFLLVSANSLTTS